MPCWFTVQFCLRLEMLFAEERMPVMCMFKCFASLLHVLFPGTCCTCLKACGHSVRGVKFPLSAAHGCHSEHRDLPRTGLGLTLCLWRLKEMLEAATLRGRYFHKANLDFRVLFEPSKCIFKDHKFPEKRFRY